MEARHLILADRHIAEGEARIERQVALVGRLKVKGTNTDTAEELLNLLRQTLVAWQSQRAMVVAELAR